MEQIKIKDLNFSYSLASDNCLKDINLTVNRGEYIVICGKSGCGKTTLLRQLKPAIAPKGKREGAILFRGESIDDLPLRVSTEKIGFVMQDPENQAVTDKVWHELAFGLENLGLGTAEIRLRISEMTACFGIDGLLDKNVNDLSGGQLQLLNLAAVMAMHPEVLILDEPTSQLDPVSAQSFFDILNRINKDMGITVILTEHRLENVFAEADKIIVMDEGRIIAAEAPCDLGEKRDILPELVRLSLPAAMRIFFAVEPKGKAPVSVRQGRRWLETKETLPELPDNGAAICDTAAVRLKNISFRYNKNDKDVISNLTASIPTGSIYSLLGSNGAGKTTLAKIIAGIEKPYSGKIKLNGKVVLMPQNVHALLTEKTGREELYSVCGKDEAVKRISELTQTAQLLDKNPWDISGGEQQRLAIAKALLCPGDIYIFDEPTKGMDMEFKTVFADILSELKARGKTVIIISHDIEFCARYSDLCALVFDGDISAGGTAREFFSRNHFYTTAANRISRGFIRNAVTCEDVIKCLKK